MKILFAAPENAWGGFIGITYNRIPDIGKLSDTAWYAHGFSGHGFMLSPMVAKLLSDYISEGKTSTVLDSLNLDRFKGKKLTGETYVVG